MRKFSRLITVLLVGLSSFLTAGSQRDSKIKVHHLQGEMAGEPTDSSIILQTRLTVAKMLGNGDLPGIPGSACFEISTSPNFANAQRSRWLRAVAETDFIVKIRATGL